MKQTCSGIYLGVENVFICYQPTITTSTNFSFIKCPYIRMHFHWAERKDHVLTQIAFMTYHRNFSTHSFYYLHQRRTKLKRNKKEKPMVDRISACLSYVFVLWNSYTSSCRWNAFRHIILPLAGLDLPRDIFSTCNRGISFDLYLGTSNPRIFTKKCMSTLRLD